MIKRVVSPGSATVEVTFNIPDLGHRRPVALVGDFNGWDASTHVLEPDGDETLAVVVELPRGRYEFRYVDGDGKWFNDDHADDYATTDTGAVNGVVEI